jgi:hypothetical protein
MGIKVCNRKLKLYAEVAWIRYHTEAIKDGILLRLWSSHVPGAGDLMELFDNGHYPFTDITREEVERITADYLACIFGSTMGNLFNLQELEDRLRSNQYKMMG